MKVELENLRKNFGATEVIRGVDMSVDSGEFVVFVGPSGCGKSTLLRLVAGLEEADGGEIRMNGARVNESPPVERGIAMVFQSYALYPHMTVRQNLSFGLRRPAGKDGAAQVEAAAKMLHLDPLLARLPRELSGGQRQRVAIGRAIVRKPNVFLFDEPLSNLDSALRGQMRLEIARLHRRLGATMIYVTHDQVEAMTLADRIVVLSGGKVEQIGKPLDLYENPANLFVASFLGSPQMNVMPCEDGGGGIARIPGGEMRTTRKLSPGKPANVGVRPEHVFVAAEGEDGLPGTIALAERLGADVFLHVDVPGGATIAARAPAETQSDAGDNVRLRFAEAHTHFFAADGAALTSKS